MNEFEPLIGAWRAEGEIPLEPPMRIFGEASIERLGTLIVFSTKGDPAEVPDSLSIVGGAPDGEPQPMHYFDSRGVKRLYMTALEGSTWKIRRAPGEDWNGPPGPASTSASSARSRLTAGRSRPAESAAWATPAISWRSTSRSTTSASSEGRSGGAGAGHDPRRQRLRRCVRIASRERPSLIRLRAAYPVAAATSTWDGPACPTDFIRRGPAR